MDCYGEIHRHARYILHTSYLTIYCCRLYYDYVVDMILLHMCTQLLHGRALEKLPNLKNMSKDEQHCRLVSWLVIHSLHFMFYFQTNILYYYYN